MDARRPLILDSQVGYLLRLAHDRAGQCLLEVLPDGVTPRDYVVLELVATGRQISQQDLCDEMTVNRTVMVKIVDGLESAGLVARRRDRDDRRRYALELSAQGRSMLVELRERAAEADRRLLKLLSQPDAARLHELLLAVVRPRLAVGPPDELLGRSVFLAHRAHVLLASVGDRLFAPEGLTTRAYVALLLLVKVAPGSQQELAEMMGVSGPFVVELIDMLEGHDYVRRRRNPADRRAHQLVVTDAGATALERLVEMADRATAEFTAPAGGGGEEELAALLSRLLDQP